MKKTHLYFLIILFVPTALLLGCGKNNRPSLEDRISDGVQQQTDSYEGVVQRLENLDVYQQGTHQLVTDNQETIILQSPTIDLNRYLDEEVLVKGSFEKGIGNAKDVFTVTDISYTDESKKAELTDYESKLYGFKFSHPSNWLLDEGQGGIGLIYEEHEVVSIGVFSDKTDLDVFVASREDGEPTEVTIGAQRSLRFVDGSQMGFYVPNPPKKKIYLLRYTPTVNAVDDPKAAENQLELFYDVLDSFELIYTTQAQGEKCGGLQQIKCAEGQICQLNSDGKYAEGVCTNIGGETSSANCPYIAPPASCGQYRISEYSQKGCPSRYECVGNGAVDAAVSFRDLNTVDAGMMPEDYDKVDSNMDADTNADKGSLVDVSDVTYRYTNDRKGFSVLMPKTWYYASFGPIDDTLWKVGFSNDELEEVKNAVITLSLSDKTGGKVSKKIDDIYYIFDGPSDLKEVMQKMADSLSLSEKTDEQD